MTSLDAIGKEMLVASHLAESKVLLGALISGGLRISGKLIYRSLTTSLGLRRGFTYLGG